MKRVDESIRRDIVPIRVERTVAHVIAPAPYGGAESVVRALASGRRQLGGRTEVIALVDTDGSHPFLEELRHAGVPVHVVVSGHRRYWAEAREVGDILCRIGAHVLHTHVYHADFVGYWAARWRRRAVVATVHSGFLGGDWKHRLYQSGDRLLLRQFDAVICVSNKTRELLLRAGMRASRVSVVWNGHHGKIYTDVLKPKAGSSDRVPTIGWVGRFTAEKGPDLFLRAFALVKGANAVMLGAGEEQQRLARLAMSLGLDSDSLRMIGQQDARMLMGGFDVLVISSRTEGVPMALLEAMAAGTPVVAFAVGGIPEILTRESGWLVPPGDISALGIAITEVLRAPEEAERRAAVARQLILTRYGLEQWTQRVEAIYEFAENVRLGARRPQWHAFR